MSVTRTQPYCGKTVMAVILMCKPSNISQKAPLSNVMLRIAHVQSIYNSSSNFVDGTDCAHTIAIRAFLGFGVAAATRLCSTTSAVMIRSYTEAHAVFVARRDMTKHELFSH